MFLSDLTPEYIKAIYLNGLNLADDDGNPFPNLMFTESIRKAIAWAQTELHLKFVPTTITVEKHDFWPQEFRTWGYVKAFWRPIISVQKVWVEFPNSNKVIEFPDDWVTFYEMSGQINMIPSSGSMSSVVIGPGGQFISLYLATHEYLPGVIRISYTSGFPLGECPDDIVDLIAKRSAFSILHTAGDLVGGAGIASGGITMDSIQQTYQTTSSPTNAGYGARIINYQREIRTDLERLKEYYHGFRMVVI